MLYPGLAAHGYDASDVEYVLGVFSVVLDDNVVSEMVSRRREDESRGRRCSGRELYRQRRKIGTEL